MDRHGRRRIGRLLGAEVRPGEGRAVALFSVDLFLLLTAYYVLKVVREPLILLEGGEVSRSYARGLQAFLLLGIIPAYGALADRIDPRRLVSAVMAFFAVCLLAFRLLAFANVRLGFAFYVWLGIFSTMVIAQLWSLANDLFTEEEGRRLFPVIAVGGTLGAIAGSQLAARLIGLLGPHALMLASFGLLAACLVLTRAAHAAARRRRDPAAGPAPARLAPPADPRGGFRLVLSDRYLLLIGLMVLVLNAINTTGEFMLARVVNAHAAAVAAGAPDPLAVRQRVIGAFYGDYQTWVSTTTALLQIFLVARLFRAVGVRGSLYVLPVLALCGYGAFALAPLLVVAEAVKVAENGGGYSLQNTAQQALFLPTSRDAKYKAKAATDTFFVRFGDLASTALVFVGVQAGLGVRGYSLANAALAAVWLALVTRLARRHRGLARGGRLERAAPLPRTH